MAAWLQGEVGGRLCLLKGGAGLCPLAAVRPVLLLLWLQMAGFALRLLPRLLLQGRPGLRLQSGSVARTEDASPEYPGIVESTKEYKFVERLIPPTRVPNPPNHDGPTPTGWKAPQDPPPDLPYMVRRSRMHNVPVYTDIIGGNREMTVVRKIEGDIWALEKDVKEHLTQTSGKTPLTQVNEITRTIRIKGYFDKELKTWLVDRGF